MTLRRMAALVTAAALSVGLAGAPGADAKAGKVTKLRPYSIPAANLAKLKQRFIKQVRARHDVGEWAPMRFELSNADLKLMGLQHKLVLMKQR